MVRESVDLLELLRKQAAGGDLDFLREAVAVLAEAVMEAEVAAQIGDNPESSGVIRTLTSDAGHQATASTRLFHRERYPAGSAPWKQDVPSCTGLAAAHRECG